MSGRMNYDRVRREDHERRGRVRPGVKVTYLKARWPGRCAKQCSGIRQGDIIFMSPIGPAHKDGLCRWDD